MLGRPIDPFGLSTFSAQLAAGVQRVKVAQAVVSSVEAQQVIVQSFYNRFLHRAADPIGLSVFVNLLLSQKDQDLVVIGLAASNEYVANL